MGSQTTLWEIKAATTDLRCQLVNNLYTQWDCFSLSRWVWSRGTIFSRWAILWKSSVKLWKCNYSKYKKKGRKVRKANKKKQQLLVWERTFVPSGLRASLLRLPRAVSGWRRKAFIPWRRAQNVWLPDTSEALLCTGVTFPGSVSQTSQGTILSRKRNCNILKASCALQNTGVQCGHLIKCLYPKNLS